MLCVDETSQRVNTSINERMRLQWRILTYSRRSLFRETNQGFVDVVALRDARATEAER